ncbi:MAG: class I SAM-dependent methyltransferase [Pseudomonadales bacterium]
MRPTPTHDEQSRQAFDGLLRAHLRQHVLPAVTTLYEERVLPKFRKEHERDPATKSEVAKAMTAENYYQTWSYMQRLSQQLLWDSVIDSVERSLPELIERAKGLTELGSLTLDPELEIPRYHTSHDIHQQPGGYHSEFTEDDVAAGAIFDTGVPIYSGGIMGAANDVLGQTVVSYFRDTFAQRKPSKILDLGCAIGNSTVPWAQAFPEAEVHGLEVGAPCLRYAHARANAMGVEVHFHQQNAESMNFPDESFDLITSCILLHETSVPALANILRECHRLLKPGGIMMHQDGSLTSSWEPLRAFMADWEVSNNNEPFLGTLRNLDLQQAYVAAGFALEKINFTTAPVGGSQPAQRGYLSGFGAVPIYLAEK